MLTRQDIEARFKTLQDNICSGLEKLDGKGRFQEDAWTHQHGGGGRSRVITEGNVLVKGGVNFSAVSGPMTERMLHALRINAENKPSTFHATGVSIVLHPHSPKVPIIHMNVRYFEMDNGMYWFGGGIDLTPHYVDVPLAARFHQRLKNVCDNYKPTFYPEFKKWADDYFFVKHRNETRGIGGIFFDRLKADETLTKKQLFDFVLAVGEEFVPAYAEQVNATRDLEFGPREQHWQKLRRGRYVEFNLVLDRGTKFGLESDGRTESILMSMPPEASWIYDYQPEPNSPEAQTLELLKKEIDWTQMLVQST